MVGNATQLRTNKLVLRDRGEYRCRFQQRLRLNPLEPDEWEQIGENVSGLRKSIYP